MVAICHGVQLTAAAVGAFLDALDHPNG